MILVILVVDINLIINLTAKIGIVLHPIGIFCSLLVLISIIFLAVVNRELANRITVRLIAAIALADLISHTAELYAAWKRSLALDSRLCHVVNGIRLFGRTFYGFTNIAICFHLYRSLVLLKRSTLKAEMYTWITTLVMVIIFTVIYGLMGAYTAMKNKNGCNPGADDNILNAVFYLIAGFVDLITIIACIFTTIVGHQSLNKWINNYAEARSNQLIDQAKFIKDRKKMAERAFLYPLSACITLPPEAAFHFFNAFGISVLELGITMSVTVGLSGLLTCLAFSFDPAGHKSFKLAYSQIKDDQLYTQSVNDNISESTVHIPLSMKKMYSK
ncbi:hypothetical protein CONCODRAFT_3287 [Conidiobolus coronatus NRRL 28638]|uniref:G-protein coupled receptors family 1 profile domain-containing protein n=1 Tax=Conidiobolus coronatus (strain ATCC 28846 / CBS 209.66 / NRRL 28638) TaxID=796925 RepID=A0A137PFE7_CONC2|nr:hypothetical protein CONCODRAFT_3287 [Conidiobolus coronatus NRRL 28638]|eukprot:KXN73727.1 hypothetical protein CONCODRAFT_3287 [Conidiobolus coronatus NRRL 28638]